MMNKPHVSLLLTKETKEKVFTTQELRRLKKFALVRYQPYPALDPELLKKIIRGADGVVTGWGTPPLTKEVLDTAPDLKIIAHSAGSVKGIVSEEVWKRKIVVTTAAPSIAIGVAEFTLGLIITGLKRVYTFKRLTHQGFWREEKEQNRVREFYKTTIGMVGAGFVGRYFIKLLKNFDVRILLYDPFVSKEEAKKLGVEKSTLEILMKSSDAVSLHAPSIPATYHMINKQNLSLMKDNALLVNTARGSLIDEKALIEILKKGRISACLDVTDPEPPDKESPLRKLDNVVLTPHIAGAITDNIYRQGRYAVTELERFFSGKNPLYPVTEKMLGKIA